MGEAPTEELAISRYDAGVKAFRRGDNSSCRRLSQEAVDLGAAAGSDRAQALGHIGLSRADFREGNYAGGLEHALIADDHAGRAGADDVRITALHMRAELHRAQREYAAAIPLYEQLLVADEAAADDRALAMEHYNLGSVHVQAGNLAAARTHLDESLRRDPTGEYHMTPYTLLGFAGLLARQGAVEAAGRILGAVEAHLDREGEVLDPAEALELQSHIAAGRAADAAGFDRAREAGWATSIDEAKALLA